MTNHFFTQFKEFMTRLEGMERTEIPQVVIHRLLEELRKRHINPVSQPELITHQLIRGFLQSLGFSKFFENVVKIIGILTQRQPIRLTAEQKENLTRHFLEIEEPFDAHKGNRKNLLSYSFVTYKFCELLGYTEFLPYLRILKAPENQLAADRIWKKICDDCGFEFIPTDPAKLYYSYNY